MCGIVGYVGVKQAAEVLLDGLSRLEYRGYDSAGLGVAGEGGFHIVKSSGRLKILEEMTCSGSIIKGNAGIGHTRWATHGDNSDRNAHPHVSQNKMVAVVHNGIIENYMSLKQMLEGKGYQFASDTDTEVIAHLIEHYYEENPFQAIVKAMGRLEGSYALGILFRDFPDKVYGVRKDSPLVLGVSSEGSMFASDVPALLRHTRDVCYLENGEIVVLRRDSAERFNMDEEKLEGGFVHIGWDGEAAMKGGYEHFMLKEIYQQPRAVADTVASMTGGERICLGNPEITKEDLRRVKRVVIAACGSAYHMGVTAKHILEGIAKLPAEAEQASEFRYRELAPEQGTLVVIISQSGETADSLAALRECRKWGLPTLAVVNAAESSIAREADHVIYTQAGPEIAVATTKAYSCQLAVMYLFAIRLAAVKGRIDDRQVREYMECVRMLPDQIELLLGNKEKIQKFSSRYLGAKDIFFMGRGMDFAISLEGSLKLKEISYIHSEAYAAGELKHGTISLIEEGTLVVAVMTQERLYPKMAGNIAEVKSRGAFVMAVTNEGNILSDKNVDYVIYLPRISPFFTNSLAIIPLQLFAYYVAIGRGCDVDKPRNLAKAVTVE